MHTEDLMRLRESDKVNDLVKQENIQQVLIKELQQLIKLITIDATPESNNQLRKIIAHIKSR
jgi:hypothetical protein